MSMKLAPTWSWASKCQWKRGQKKVCYESRSGNYGCLLYSCSWSGDPSSSFSFFYLWGIAWPAALTRLQAPEVKLGWWSVPQDSCNSTQVRLWQSTSFHQSCFAEAWFRATLPIVLLPDSDLILIGRLLLMTFRGPYNPKRQYICIHSWWKR